jgi:glycosyltransferase involved in cell wall biosynthesis
MMTLTLIVSSYNQMDLLKRVLLGVARQKTFPDEVILADDGSTDNTQTFFREWSEKQNFPAHLLSQPHSNFRKARILNQAISTSQGDYIVFLDGDSIPHPYFVADHRQLAQNNFFVQGHRALVGRKSLSYFGKNTLYLDSLRALFTLQLKGIKHAFRWPKPLTRIRTDLHGIRGCNLGIWREDLLKINGYNEDFVGWGREDSELAVRLMNLGSKRIDVRGRACCFHLWHPPAPRTEFSKNDQLLEQAIREGHIRCQKGITKGMNESSPS